MPIFNKNINGLWQKQDVMVKVWDIPDIPQIFLLKIGIDFVLVLENDSLSSSSEMLECHLLHLSHFCKLGSILFILSFHF